jgi:hypothetical protein
MAPVSTGSSSYYPTSTAFLAEAVYAGAAMTDDLRPSPVPSVIHHTPAASDPGLHQFIIYMVVLAAVFLLYCAYVLGKSYIGKWCGASNVDDDDEEVCLYSRPSQCYLTSISRSTTLRATRSDRLRSLSPRLPQRSTARILGCLTVKWDRYISVKRICSPVAGASSDEQYALTLLARFLQSVDIRLGTL